MPTYRTNALYQAPTVDNAVYEQFGMQPGMDRLNLLPRHDAKLGWIAPNALYQIARALVSPGVAAQGGNVSPEDAVNFAGNVSLGSLGTSALMKRPAPGPGRTVAQTVYHGSPHNFDKFDMSKIGTGEGAQAYGHGLYVAENPNVAKQYKLAGSDGAYKIEGAPPRPKVDPLGPGRDAAVAYDDAMAKAKSLGLDGAITYYQDQARFFPQYADEYAKPLAQLQQMKASGAKSTQVGSLYHVDLPDHHIANMLDWDKPLSQQPAVSAALDELIPRLTKDQAALLKADRAKLTGWGAYTYATRALGSERAASEFFKSKGIPGIKYLDGTSRTAGDGTRNFVVFDDKLLKVLKKE